MQPSTYTGTQRIQTSPLQMFRRYVYVATMGILPPLKVLNFDSTPPYVSSAPERS